MRDWLTRLWYDGGAASLPLRPLSWLYGGIVAARRSAYSRGWLETVVTGPRVVVVGNVTVGGTGKTPLVAWLATQLALRGRRVGIVSRGYGSAASIPRLVTSTSSAEEAGDEPLLLARRTRLPVAVGRDRVAAVGLLARTGIDTVVADDGLQHLRLARRCEIAVVDGERGVGNGLLLPAGPLREPAGALQRVDAVVLNGGARAEAGACAIGATSTDLPPIFRMRLEPDAAVPLAEGADPRDLETFRGERVHAVAGIGNPGRFFGMLRRLGLDPIEHPFADHHPFQPRDVQFDDGLPVLMTEKDAVKCRPFAGPRHWYVPVTAELDEAAAAALVALVTAKLDT